MGFIKKVKQRSDFSNSIKTLKPSTKAAMNNTLKLFSKYCESENSTLDEAVEEMKIADKKDVFSALQGWVNWLYEKGLSTYSIPVYFSHIRTYLYFYGITISDQERKHEIKYPRIIQDEKHGLSLNEVKRILECSSPKRRPLYLTLLSSGIRIGEAMQLRKKDLQLINKNFMINVRGETTKTQKGRKCFMSFEATKLVFPRWKSLKDNELVFATNENPVHARTNEQIVFDRVRSLAFLTDRYDSSNRFHVSFHSFRAYFITKVSRHDHNLAKRLAGQKSYLDQYDRLDINEKLELYLKLELDLVVYDSNIKDMKIEELEQKNKDIEDLKKKLAEHEAHFERLKVLKKI